MKIALDAMGGDFGPAVVVEGAVAAAREFGLASVLVGDKASIEREIIRLKAQDLPVAIRHASQVVGMAEAPSQALRRKRDSSLRVAAELVKEGECSALVSAGNTGAAMAIGMYVLGVLPGVDRPAIAAPLPSLSGYTILIDAGANVELESHGKVTIDHVAGNDEATIKALVQRHLLFTGSERARRILENWAAYLPRFVKVMPLEYRRALGEMAQEQARRDDVVKKAEVRAND